MNRDSSQLTGELSNTPRTRLRRGKEKGRSDRGELFEVLRACFVCHLGVVVDGTPMVVPTVYGFDDDMIYLHGSVAGRSLTQQDAEVCVTVTAVDGLVLARSVFEHSVNYRCAMIYGVPRVLDEPTEKLAALRVITEHTAPGQWDYVRAPNRRELAATTVLAVPLAEASVKIRSGPPSDADSPDGVPGLWAGELPLVASWQQPVPDPTLDHDVPVPPHIAGRSGTTLGRP